MIKNTFIEMGFAFSTLSGNLHQKKRALHKFETDDTVNCLFIPRGTDVEHGLSLEVHVSHIIFLQGMSPGAMEMAVRNCSFPYQKTMPESHIFVMADTIEENNIRNNHHPHALKFVD